MNLISHLSQEHFEFPDVETALKEPDGLLAIGGDLEPNRLIEAYKRGVFPWYEAGQPILWWSPDPRMVLYPEKFHLSKSLKKTIRREAYSVRFDTDFSAVIEACGNSEGRAGKTWITPEMVSAYQRLHKMGIAHSVEVYRDELLVGGLYGVALGKVFFGESMFSLENNASKVASAYLCAQLQRWNFSLIDCQVHSEHLQSLGAEEIDREAFCKTLNANQKEVGDNRTWQFDADILDTILASDA